MSTSIVRRSLTLFALLSSLCVGNVALATKIDPREIPTQLVNTPDVDDRNGACSKCRVRSLAAAKDATQDDATLELYCADEQGSLHGYVELTILLDNGTYLVETIEGVDLVNGELTSFQLEPQPGWSWREDVEHLWVEVVRTAP